MFQTLSLRHSSRPVALPGVLALTLAAGLALGPSARAQTSAGGFGAAEIDALWKDEVLPACSAAKAKYPFDAASGQDLNRPDFERLFAAGGSYDRFFQEYLAAFTDASQHPWALSDSAPEGLSAEALAPFEAAAAIRAALFDGAGAKAGFDFSITPFAIDAAAYSMVMEVDGHSVSFTKNDSEPKPTALHWPGVLGVARVSLGPEEDGKENTRRFDGMWALFRLLESGDVRPSETPGQFRLMFTLGDRLAIYTLAMNGKTDLPTDSLAGFACPASLQ